MTNTDDTSISDRIRMVIEMAVRNCTESGGPFAAIVVRNGKVIAEGRNQVTSQNDPTAHAEIQAIREACRVLESFQLTDCEIYTSCEPCPMCLGAIYWARPARVYYAAKREDAAEAGFDDDLIYRELNLDPVLRSIPMQHVPSDRSLEPFECWSNLTNKTRY